MTSFGFTRYKRFTHFSQFPIFVPPLFVGSQWLLLSLVAALGPSCPTKRWPRVLIAASSKTTAMFAMPDGTFTALSSKYFIGGIVGTIIGGLIGSISGEINATTDRGSHRLLVAGVFGLMGGCLGATKLDAIWLLFNHFHWKTPI